DVHAMPPGMGIGLGRSSRRVEAPIALAGVRMSLLTSAAAIFIHRVRNKEPTAEESERSDPTNEPARAGTPNGTYWQNLAATGDGWLHLPTFITAPQIQFRSLEFEVLSGSWRLEFSNRPLY